MPAPGFQHPGTIGLIELDHTLTVPHRYGVTLVNLGRIEDGLVHLQKTLQLEPQNSNLLYCVALVHGAMDQPHKALNAALQARAQQPSDQAIIELVSPLFDKIAEFMIEPIGSRVSGNRRRQSRISIPTLLMTVDVWVMHSKEGQGV